MARISGKSGNVTIASGSGNWGGDGTATGIKIANVSAFTADLTSDTHDVTTFASAGFREFIGGYQSCTGTLDVFADDTVVLAISNSSNPTVTLKYYDGASDRQIAFVALLSAIGTGADGNTGNPVVYRYSFVSTGTITPA